MRSLWFAFFWLTAVAALGQTEDAAKRVYRLSQDSVFLVYLNDSSGTPSALGSAFLVAPRVLITNSHVVEAGNPVLAVGPVRIPLKILRVDQKNDLAVLSVDVDLTSKPLPLASEEVSPGEQVFAIGNPEGLEKTISEGIISGLRKRGDRDLLQITSPISHGSSGGPILNFRGEVVGVAVGMLEDGQNLNFAVPVAYVRSILAQKSDAKITATDVSNSLAEAKELLKKRQDDKYSDDPASDYQQDTRQLLDLMQSTVEASSKEDQLTELACLGTQAIDLSAVGINAARKLVRNKPSPENRALLSYTLYDRAVNESLFSQWAQKGSSEETEATAAHEQFLAEANREAGDAARLAKGERSLVAKFVLAYFKMEHAEYADAIPLHSLIANGKLHVCGSDLAVVSLRNLVFENDQTKRPEDAERWFRQYAGHYEPTPYEWDSEGDRRTTAQDYVGAADAYERAAGASPDYYGYDYCYASVDRYYQPTTSQDAILTDGRKCLDASVKQTGKQYQGHFTKELPLVYRLMAEALDARGVYPSALEYIKESVSAKPDDPFALHIEASVFQHLGRYSECISAAQAALRVSDGKFPWMQFRLGSCYFDTENWNQAAASFRIAAEADKGDVASAYNLGLSLSRQGYEADARQWYREALNRKPNEEVEAKILNALK